MRSGAGIVVMVTQPGDHKHVSVFFFCLFVCFFGKVVKDNPVKGVCLCV